MVDATAVAPAASAAPVLTIAEKLTALEAQINGTVFERVTETRCLVNALVSRRHMCMIGSPGIAKSFLTRSAVALIDGIGQGQYFEWLLSKFSTPEAILGPYSLPELEKGHYIRNTRNKLPEAKLAFISEIWKANSATLNELLPITNERLFYNNGTPTQVPLACLVADSNETPENATELGALWDRFAFRLFTKPIQGEGNFDAMLRAAAGRMAARLAPVPVITWDEITQAQQDAAQIILSDDVYEAFNTLRASLAKAGIAPSERRFVECIPIIQAQAYRAGRTVADIADMRLLSHVLWDLAAQQPTVAKLVSELANPLDKVAMEMLEDVEKLAIQIDDLLRASDNNQERSRKAIEVHGKLVEAADEIKKLRAQAKADGRQSEFIGPLRARVVGLTRKLLKEVFTIDEAGLTPDAPDA